MKFNVKKFRNGPSYYSLMDTDKIAFHDALNRMIYIDGDCISWRFSKRKTSKTGRMTFRRSMSVEVFIDGSGKLHARIIRRAKGEKQMVNVNDVQEMLDDLIYFVETCYDHDYLIK